MQPSKIKLSLAIGALCFGASGASMADTFNLTVNTIQDVTITPVQDLDFGESLTTDPGVVCTMAADKPLGATVRSDTTGVFDGSSFGALSVGCIGTTGTPGVYEISGEPGLDVKITIQDEVQTGGDFTFNPAGGGGVAVSYDGDNAATTDTAVPLSLNAPVTVTLANVVGTDPLPAQAGKTYFTVGGTVTVGPTGLTSDTDYVATFNVNVIY